MLKQLRLALLMTLTLTAALPMVAQVRHVTTVNPSTKQSYTEVYEFEYVDIQPQFPGGDAAFYQYMAQHVRYPEVATENGVEGTVTVKFIVEADGRITHVQAVDSPSDEADAKVYAYRLSDKQPSEAEDDEGRRALREAAEELFRGMPPLEPGRQSGKPVRVQMTKKVYYALR